MTKFSRRVDVHIFKDEPVSCTQWRDAEGVDDAETNGGYIALADQQYAEYLHRFQPYRWHAKAANNRIISDGERYFNFDDCLDTIVVLFGDDTTLYWTPKYGEQRGLNLLRYGKTDRDNLTERTE